MFYLLILSMEKEKAMQHRPYLTHVPENLKLSEHFSSLMLGFDRTAVALEIVSIALLTGIAWHFQIRVEGSMSLVQVLLAKFGLSLFRRVYNNYLEAAFCAFQQHILVYSVVYFWNFFIFSIQYLYL